MAVHNQKMNMINRRRLLQLAAAVIATEGAVRTIGAEPLATFSMPDESHRHERTWMAFVANKEIWSRRQIPEVKRNLATLATTIAQYEPVSMLVADRDIAQAEKLLAPEPTRYPIELVEFVTDDLWLRDTGPTFVIDKHNQKVAVDFNFNGWGNKQSHSNDKKVAGFIADETGVPLVTAGIVLEGGCFEVDGNGTAIMTKSCIVNDNRNPEIPFQDIEHELKRLLGLQKIIWLEGIAGADITDGHTDFYARFVRPGKVVVSRDNYRASPDYQITRENIDILSRSTDAHGNLLEVMIIDTPDLINEQFGVQEFAAGYIGYYVCNNAVIAQKFGDRQADQAAAEILQQCYPDRVIEQLAIDAIASGGGSIHCATQQEIAV